MINTSFKMSEKAFYLSRFSGILPCEILEIGSKKIRILIESYNSKIWVPIARLMSTSEFSLKNEKSVVRLIKTITTEPAATKSQISSVLKYEP